MQLTSQTVREYTELLAGSDPTPGGGSAAALAGALAAASAAMVGSFTVGKPKFAAVEAEVGALLDKLQALRGRLLDLTDLDAEAYAEVGAAYSMPKGTHEEKTLRQAAIQNALKSAARVPLGVVAAAGEIAELLPALAEKGNPNLLSDVGVAAILAHAAFETGRLNVEVNLAGLHDTTYIAEARAAIADAEAKLHAARQVAARVAEKVISP
ncbi:MAG: cyclodeaminase/cyclohydrolase family protein [candidate division WS1 bacterium]|jgi:formiminotetrahydrofolate cyclodeaminase|nr:cyclodeaminase/cyclohydrolase family protein [candidate division WS1 bacterium]